MMTGDTSGRKVQLRCVRPIRGASRAAPRPSRPGTAPRDTRRVRIEATRGDITVEGVDAIVNAANSALRPGAGVCGAIYAAAGPGLAPATEALGGCATGDAVLTPGFTLPARFVVHTVGPVWRGGGAGEEQLLASCYRRSVAVAAAAGARSLAFPAISTGVFGYPPEAAAHVAVATLRSITDAAPVDLVRLVAFDDGTLALYRRELGVAPNPSA